MQVTPENTVGTKTFHLQGTVNRATVIARRDEGGFRLGIAICSSSDQFSRKRGRMIAFGRLETGRAQGRENGRGYFFLPGFDPCAEQCSDALNRILEWFGQAAEDDLELLQDLGDVIADLPKHLELTVAEVIGLKAAAAV